jgi:hypothetical protein
VRNADTLIISQRKKQEAFFPYEEIPWEKKKEL